MQWWGFKKTNGEICIKGYKNKKQIERSHRSRVIDATYGPIDAENYFVAAEKIVPVLREGV